MAKNGGNVLGLSDIDGPLTSISPLPNFLFSPNPDQADHPSSNEPQLGLDKRRR
jgi:hypothetical protein